MRRYESSHKRAMHYPVLPEDGAGVPASPGVVPGLGFFPGVAEAFTPQALGRSSRLDEQDAIDACFDEEAWLGQEHPSASSSSKSSSSSSSRRLKKHQRQALATRLLSVGQRPGQDFFQHLGARLQEYGVATPSVQVELRGLTVTTEAVVGSAGIPTAANFALRLAKTALGRQGDTQQLTILDNISGVLKPGRCTLLLGPPGSGKSAFLRVLGNHMRGCSRLKVSGEVLYNGHTKEQFVVQRTAAFVDQHDSHIANMSVAETVEFAHLCHTGYSEPAFHLPGELRKAKVAASVANLNQAASEAGMSCAEFRRMSNAATFSCGGLAAEDSDLNLAAVEGLLALDEIEQLVSQVWSTGAKTEVIMRLLGLGHCRSTLVGDGGLMQRGISGGERKRLTTAEMVVGPQRLLLMDEISTGLDSATLHSVITFFIEMSHALNLTTVISLLQPPPEVFGLFDDLMLLSAGKLLYHGPLAGALPHSQQLGFVCPVRKDVASFLLELTTPAGQMAYASKQLVCSAHMRGGPATAGGMLLPLQEMSERFWSSPAGQHMSAQLAQPFDPQDSHPAALEFQPYALKPLQAISVVTRRQVKLVLRDKVLLRGRLLQVIVVSLIVGSLFFQLGHGVNDARSCFGAAFMAVLFMAMGSMPQIGVVMAQKAVWLKHRDSLLYPGYAHGVAMALGQLPVSVLEATLFSCIVYPMMGFHAHAAAFFTFWGVITATNACLSALFRFLAVLAPNPTLAAAYGGLALLILILTSGFAIVKGSIPPYWIWAYWISPFAYAMRAVVVNEFTGPDWSQRMPGLVKGASTLGEAALLSFDFATDRSWVANGIIFLIGAYLLLSVVTCIALDWVSGPSQVMRLPDPAQLTKVRAAAQRRRTTAQLQLVTAAEKAAKQHKASIGGASGSIAGGMPISCGASSRRNSSVAGPAVQRPRSSAGGKRCGGARGSMQPMRRRGTTGASSARSSTAASVCETAVTVGALGLEFTPITLVFRDLRYWVPNPAFARRFKLPGGAKKTSADDELAMVTAASHSTAGTAGAGGGIAKPGKAFDGGPRLRPASSAGRQQQQFAAARGGASSSGCGDYPSDCSSPYSSGGSSSSSGSGSIAVNVVIDGCGSSCSAASLAGCVGGGLLHGAPQAAALSTSKRELELLKGVSGFAVPGKLMALMGGSGAGKTTLLDVICGRKTVGRVSGKLLTNGRPVKQASWSRVLAYVEQMDVHSPGQTVVEALWFSGRLRLGRSVTDQQVRAYVDDVIAMVDLTDQSYSLVGTPGAGLSSEQLKRLTIAVELVSNPSIVFMDEPISGLDARAAAIVMSAVRNVALSGRTVMVTMHQPTTELFEAFDTLLLLQRGGRTTYFGPLGHQSSQLVEYLQSVPGTQPLAPGQNPATWMLEVTGGSMAIAASPNLQVDWPAVYAASSLAAANAAEAQQLVQQGLAAGQELRLTSTYAQPFRVQLRELLRKYWLVYWRTPSYTLARCFLTLVVAFIFGSMFFQAGVLPQPYASMGSIQNIIGIIFSSTNFLGMTNLMAVMPLAGMERVVFYRERGALPYDAFAYGTAIALVEVPWLLLQACLFVPVVYLMVGFQKSFAKGVYYFLMFLASITFYSTSGQLFVYITPSQQVAQVFGASTNFLFNCFNGFVIAYPAMPHYWRWLNRAVPTTWVLYGLGASQLGDVEQLMQFAGRRTPVSKFVRGLMGYEYELRFWALGIMVAFVVALRIASILALRYANFLRR